MKKIAYTGTKTYNDKRHGSFSVWQPGEEKLVSAEAARKLLKFCEFQPAKDDKKAKTTAPVAQTQTPADPYEAAALAQQQKDAAAATSTTDTSTTQTESAQDTDAAAQAQEAAMTAKLQEEAAKTKQQEDMKEAMLLEISNWDKDQLKDYAAKYDVNLNKSRGLQSLRDEVTGLVEVHGVM